MSEDVRATRATTAGDERSCTCPAFHFPEGDSVAATSTSCPVHGAIAVWVRMASAYEDHLAAAGAALPWNEQSERDHTVAIDAMKAAMRVARPASSAPDYRAEADALAEAAALKRNTIIHGDAPPKRFFGEWVAVPREDFDNLRAALARYAARRE